MADLENLKHVGTWSRKLPRFQRDGDAGEIGFQVSEPLACDLADLLDDIWFGRIGGAEDGLPETLVELRDVLAFVLGPESMRRCRQGEA